MFHGAMQAWGLGLVGLLGLVACSGSEQVSTNHDRQTPAVEAGAGEVAPTLARTQPDHRVDPTIHRLLENQDRVPVIVIGREQLIHGPNALERFAAQHAGRGRSWFRKKLVADLQAMATAQLPSLRGALAGAADVRPLWILSGVAATLSSAQIEAAAAHPSVGFIYPAMRVDHVAGTIAALPSSAGGPPVGAAKPKPRGAFDVGKRRITWNLREVKADQAWAEHGAHGEGVVIAMHDSGLALQNPDLRDALWVNTAEVPNNGIDDDENGLVDDVHGYDFMRRSADVSAFHEREKRKFHGTYTAGIAAGDGSGGTITGVAPRARVMVLMGDDGHLFTSAQILQYALEQDADILNMSFSEPHLGEARGAWRLMADQATAAGLVMTSGAGNFGSGAGKSAAQIPVQIRVPEGIPSVICVGGLEQNRAPPPFVSFGPVEWSGVPFYADHPLPGGLTKPDVVGFTGPGFPLLEAGGYLDPNERRRGNSFSSPHVAGTVALMLSKNPELTPWRIKEILERTAQPLSNESERTKNNETGMGLVNAHAAVAEAMTSR